MQLTNQIQGNEQKPFNPAQNLEPRKEKASQSEDKGFNFEDLLLKSNKIRDDELSEEKKKMGGGDVYVGETKDDKKFREQLEKITGKKQGGPKNKLDKDDYLTLLVTQLKYQDPSKPMENHEMASQMAQLNSVQQLMGINKTLEELKGIQSTKTSEKLVGYIGKQIDIQSNEINLDVNNKTSKGQFELKDRADFVTLDIRNSNGETIRTINIREKDKGFREFSWDGKNNGNEMAPPGRYAFYIAAFTKEGKPVENTSHIRATVKGISELSAGGKLETDQGKYDPAQIVSIWNET